MPLFIGKIISGACSKAQGKAEAKDMIVRPFENESKTFKAVNSCLMRELLDL